MASGTVTFAIVPDALTVEAKPSITFSWCPISDSSRRRTASASATAAAVSSGEDSFMEILLRVVVEFCDKRRGATQR